MNVPSVTCPVSQKKIDDNVSRIIAALVIIVVLTAMFFTLPLLLLALSIDFCLRTFTTGKYSPLKYMARKISGYFGIPEKIADAAPKKFATGMGLFFSISIAVLLWFHYNIYADSLAAILLVCAGLEAFKGFCLGCITYTYLVLPFISKENSEQSTISINL